MQKSILSFNKSVNPRKDFITNRQPYQIFPIQQQFYYEGILKTFPIPSFDNDILIHTSFATLPFSSKQVNSVVSFDNIRGYCKIAKRLRTPYILIHGPANLDGYNNYITGLQNIKDIVDDWCIENDYLIVICIEIPAFASTLKDVMLKYVNINEEIIKNDAIVNKVCYEFIDNYLSQIPKYNFQVVIDTAHLHANGLDGKEMILLLNKYIEYYDFIHLNGNVRDKFKPDKHVQLDSADDKIVDSDIVLSEVAKLGKICICETKDGDYIYYDEISREYGYDLVDPNNGYSY